MIDFVKWLAAFEIVDGAPEGVYQMSFSEAIHQGQLESLLDNSLASAFVDSTNSGMDDIWTGTPSALLAELNKSAPPGTQRSRDWPHNPIALSKRLKSLAAALTSQGIHVSFGRGKNRNITVDLKSKKYE